MAAPVQPLHLLCLIAMVLAEPAPGRIPKVYNALITSNQNLEPSKAYPVYQPVLHDFAPFPFQPAVFYGDFSVNNVLPQAPAAHPENPDAAPPAPQPAPPASKEPVDEKPPQEPSPPSPPPKADGPTAAPPLPPKTESPIPLNEFGLPPQVLPLGRYNPAYNGFTQVGPFTYTYPSFRFYDPYDPFSLSPYANYPLYRPVANVLEPIVPSIAGKEVSPSSASPALAKPDAQTPPPEPSDLNVLNYASKDPAIPNVPPPPLPHGGLKSDKAE